MNHNRKTAWKIFFIALIAQGLFTFSFSSADSTDPLQAQIDADNQQIAILNQKIAEYQAKLNELGADKKTLQAAINALDLQRSKVQAQVSATQHQISATQLQIQQLDGQINDTQDNITEDQEALKTYLQSIQRADTRSLLMQVLSDGDLSQFWGDMDSALKIQGAVRNRTESLKDKEKTLANAQASVQEKQNALATQKKLLSSQQQSLTATVQSKNQLLAQTKAQESTYQKLLTAAQKELESYSTFTQNAGGAGLLPHQTICDDWGCYYNQRDALWGNIPLNGTKYSLAGDGCLVTAMAMVMTHYGYPNVTPMTINSNPSNFASYYPAFLLYTISADGVSATRISAAIDAILSTGNPVVVGLHAYGGTHFVVLISGSKGNYVMRDPYIANGKDIPFAKSYTVRSIYNISKVVING
jgi:peptidoglycan hydrolase CwlO-like protein